MIFRMKVSAIHTRNVYPDGVLASWGDVGDMEAGDEETPQTYYAKLRRHMSAGGSIPPIEVGHNKLDFGDRRVLVFNGHHRLAIAGELGWEWIEVTYAVDFDALRVELEKLCADAP